MLQNYFYDQHGLEQREEVKREKAVAAVLELLHAGSTNTPMHNTLTNIDGVSKAADSIQAALSKK